MPRQELFVPDLLPSHVRKIVSKFSKLSAILKHRGKSFQMMTSIVRRYSKDRFTRYDFVVFEKFTTGLRLELFRVNQTYNSLTIVVYGRKKCRSNLKHNLVPRVLSLLRESTLVTAGHVSARF